MGRDDEDVPFRTEGSALSVVYPPLIAATLEQVRSSDGL